MDSSSNERLMAVGKALVRAAPSAWAKLEIHATGAGSMTETALDIHQPDGTVDTSGALDRDGRAACHDLRESMFQPGKGTWFNATLTLDRAGKFNAEFDYDNPPFDGDADPDLLLEDQRLFPRDPEHLPDWHPASQPS